MEGATGDAARLGAIAAALLRKAARSPPGQHAEGLVALTQSSKWKSLGVEDKRRLIALLRGLPTAKAEQRASPSSARQQPAVTAVGAAAVRPDALDSVGGAGGALRFEAAMGDLLSEAKESFAALGVAPLPRPAPPLPEGTDGPRRRGAAGRAQTKAQRAADARRAAVARMMHTFGDAAAPLDSTATAAAADAEAFAARCAAAVRAARGGGRVTLRDWAALAPGLTRHYFRWRKLKAAQGRATAAAAEGGDGDDDDDVDDDDAVEDGEAVSGLAAGPAEDGPGAEAGRFAERRRRWARVTEAMTAAEYRSFVRDREASFLGARRSGQAAFLERLALPPPTPSRGTVSLLAWIAYDRVGCIVEAALAARAATVEGPLTVEEVRCGTPPTPSAPRGALALFRRSCHR